MACQSNRSDGGELVKRVTASVS